MLPEHIDHNSRLEQFGLFERPPGDASNMRVELVERARFDGVMTGVMRARGKLVDDNPLILGNEEFDGEDAGQFEALRQTQSEFDALPSPRLR